MVSSPIDGRADDLLPDERAACARFAERRVREFATGRRCARQLLGQMGWTVFPLGRDAQRVPLWPPGVVGSISHTKDLCLVAVASTRDVAGLGVDVEGAEPLASKLWSRICTPRERRWLEAQPQTERGRWAKLLFSVKECSYKAWFPLTRQRWGFQEIEVELDPSRAEFRVSMAGLEEHLGHPATGVYRRGRRWVMAGLSLPARNTP